MKIKLLNDGGYGDMENVVFPVVVETSLITVTYCGVKGGELMRVGAIDFNYDKQYAFSIDTECELIKHVETREGDERCCTCGLRWGINEESPHNG